MDKTDQGEIYRQCIVKQALSWKFWCGSVLPLSPVWLIWIQLGCWNTVFKEGGDSWWHGQLHGWKCVNICCVLCWLLVFSPTHWMKLWWIYSAAFASRGMLKKCNWQNRLGTIIHNSSFKSIFLTPAGNDMPKMNRVYLQNDKSYLNNINERKKVNTCEVAAEVSESI